LWLVEPLIAENVVTHRKGHRPEHTCSFQRVQTKPIVIRRDQECNCTVEQFIVRLLLGSEGLAIMRLLTQLQRPKQRKHSPQALLKDGDRRHQSLLKAQTKINLSKLVAGVRDVVRVLDDGIDESLFGSKGPEDRALCNTCGLSNLPGTDVAPELLQERLGCRDKRCSPFIKGKRRGASHQTILVSEHSLSNGLFRSVIVLVTVMLISKREGAKR